MSKFKNSNATFWVIFKQCAFMRLFFSVFCFIHQQEQDIIFVICEMRRWTRARFCDPKKHLVGQQLNSNLFFWVLCSYWCTIRSTVNGRKKKVKEKRKCKVGFCFGFCIFWWCFRCQFKIKNRRAGNTAWAFISVIFFFFFSCLFTFWKSIKKCTIFHIICTPNCLSDAK